MPALHALHRAEGRKIQYPKEFSTKGKKTYLGGHFIKYPFQFTNPSLLRTIPKWQAKKKLLLSFLFFSFFSQPSMLLYKQSHARRGRKGKKHANKRCKTSGWNEWRNQSNGGKWNRRKRKPTSQHNWRMYWRFMKWKLSKSITNLCDSSWRKTPTLFY